MMQPNTCKTMLQPNLSIEGDLIQTLDCDILLICLLIITIFSSWQCLPRMSQGFRYLSTSTTLFYKFRARLFLFSMLSFRLYKDDLKYLPQL